MAERPPDAAAPRPARSFDVRLWLPLIGLIVGLWAMLPKFLTPPLNTDDTVEVVDHVFPGLLVIAVSAAVLFLRGRPRGIGQTAFFAGLAVLLAGFWMVVTHVPLVAQALRDEAPWPGTIWHTASALATFGVGLWWSVTHWSDLNA